METDRTDTVTANTAAVEFFARRLAFETDPSDVIDALAADVPLQLVDVRSTESWDQGRASAAVHIPRREIAVRALAELDRDVPVVVYCWGPACNGGVKGALEFARLGFEVREMIGGFEYWAREGLPVSAAAGDATRRPDPLTSPVGPDPVGPGPVGPDPVGAGPEGATAADARPPHPVGVSCAC